MENHVSATKEILLGERTTEGISTLNTRNYNIFRCDFKLFAMIWKLLDFLYVVRFGNSKILKLKKRFLDLWQLHGFPLQVLNVETYSWTITQY